jgi:hypothetical protein
MRPILVALLSVLALLAPGTASAQRAQAVVGTVRDTTGAPVAGALVRVGDREATTSDRGTFRIEGLTPGRHLLTIRRIGFRPVRSRVAVLATEPTEVEYLLVPAPVSLPATVVEATREGIFGVVGDTAYRSVVGARVQLLGPRTRDVRTDSAGRFAFAGVLPGQYVVRVTMEGHGERRVVVELRRGEGRELVVLLAPAKREVHMRANIAALDLARRMTMGLRQERLLGDDLLRYAGAGGCGLASRVAGEAGGDPLVILDGSAVLGRMRPMDLCAWRPEELEMVEYGRDVCREVTHTIADLVGVACNGFRTSTAPRSIVAAGSAARRGPVGYVVLWEKR